jgi:hypothetical protein
MMSTVDSDGLHDTQPVPGAGLDSLPLIAHLIGLYLAVPIVLPGGMEFPVATTLVTAPILIAMNAPRVRASHLAWMIGLVAVAGLTLFMAPHASAFLVPRAKGLILWTYSIVVAYALVLELLRWRRERLAKLLLAFSLTLLAGCVLEIVGLLRPLSHAFRSVAFPTGALEFRERDLEIAGFERPLLFTSEPSDVAKFLLLTCFGYVALSASRVRHLVGLGLCVAATALTRSPITVLLLPLQALVIALGQPLVGRPRWISRPLTLIVLGVAAIVATGAAAVLLGGRISQAVEGRDASSVIRIVAPLAIAWETLRASPWWGAGISGTESIEESIVVGFELAGVAALADPTALGSEMSLANLVANAFWLHWINLGLLGGFIAILLLGGLMKSFGVHRVWFALGAIFVFSQTMGAAHGPYFWSFVAMCIAVAWHLDSSVLLELRPSGTVEDAVDLQQPAGSGI